MGDNIPNAVNRKHQLDLDAISWVRFVTEPDYLGVANACVVGGPLCPRGIGAPHAYKASEETRNSQSANHPRRFSRNYRGEFDFALSGGFGHNRAVRA